MAHNTTHVQWQGCSLHDLIQPAFSFLVGAAMPFSLANRRARGESFQRLLGHALWRSVALILLGIFLRSLERPHTYWTFEDTLTQIGMGYTFLFLLAFTSLRVQIAVFATILVAFWGAFALYPLPGPDFDYTQVGVPSQLAAPLFGVSCALQQELEPVLGVRRLVPEPLSARVAVSIQLGGLVHPELHPDPGNDAAGAVDRTLVADGPSTLEKLKGLIVGGIALTIAGLLFQWLHICPIVKRIWTSSYTLYSGGLVVADPGRFLRAAGLEGLAPLVVPAARDRRELDRDLRHELDDRALHLVSACASPRCGSIPGDGPAVRAGAPRRGRLIVFWSILYWMYRRKIFLRI